MAALILDDATARLDRQVIVMNLFSAYLNTGDVESMSQLMRDNCTNECEVSRFLADETVRLPSVISGIESIVQYATLLAEIPDSVIQFEEYGRSTEVVLFGYTFAGTMPFRLQVEQSPNGTTRVLKTSLGELTVDDQTSSGMISLLSGADELIFSIEVRIVSN
jgi:hypothetical protein